MTDSKSAFPAMDDIPEARRDAGAIAPARLPRRWLWAGGLSLILASGGLLWYLMRPIATATEDQTEAPIGTALDLAAPVPTPVPTPAPTVTDATPAVPPSTPAADDPTLLGHREYAEADPSGLVAIQSNPQVRLKPAAAAKVNQMIAAARASGVQLGAASGFRTWEEQRQLFFEVKAERGETSEKRAEVSAPPGYSEHHTGYAVDFVDLSAPETDLEPPFEQTPAFAWLQQHGASYGFEMSFTKDHPTISYEPWHWRYVGDPESLKTFFQNP